MKTKLCLVVSSPLTLRTFVAPHVEALRERYSVSVIANAAGGDAPALPDGVELISLPIERRIDPVRDLVALARLLRLFRRSSFTAVQSVTPKAGLLAMAAARLARVPVRIHFFTGQVWVTRRGPARALVKLADHVIGLLATHVLVDSASQRDFLIDNGIVSAAKSRVLAHGSISGVDAARFRPDAQARARVRASLGIAADALVFLYVGRLNPDKGLLDLAAGFSRVAAELPGAALLVVGPDEDGTAAGMRGLLGDARERAWFAPETDRPEDYMAAADVFCLPSYREGFGSTVIEAAATGVPAIGSRIYGITDAIEENATGLLFEPRDVEDLARCMRRLADAPAVRREMGERARARALRDFRMERVVSELVRFYGSVLGPTRQ